MISLNFGAQLWLGLALPLVLIYIQDFNGKAADDSEVPHPCSALCLLQATSYLVTAWEALATQLGKPMAEVPVEWNDVSIQQAVQADEGSSVTLSVLLDRSHRFQVGQSPFETSFLSALARHHGTL